MSKQSRRAFLKQSAAVVASAAITSGLPGRGSAETLTPTNPMNTQPSETATAAPAGVPAHLPGEVAAEDILNGVYPYPPSRAVEFHDDWTGFAKDRLSPVPAPGIHPRILLSPEDLPDLRRRLKETETGRALYATLQSRLDKTIRKVGTYYHDLYELLAAGDREGARALAVKNGALPEGIGHSKPFAYTFALEAFDAMVTEDDARGRKVGIAAATAARLGEPEVNAALQQPLSDDVSRVKMTATGQPAIGTPGLTFSDLLSSPSLPYTYDFAYNFMAPEDREAVRRVIARMTQGRLWMGARLPHHFRNWNWIGVGLAQPLMALAIEGEEGYDPRVYHLAVQIARDYLNYGITENGFITEAVGYSQFGLVWLTPFTVAAARRGDNLLVNSHNRATIDWYLHSMEPDRMSWTSHGDGGDSGPAAWNLSMWRYFYPQDSKIDFLWQSYLHSEGPKALSGDIHLIEPLLWATDGPTDGAGKPVDYADGAALNLPSRCLNQTRSSLLARNAWNANAAHLEFECRTDSVDASHEHADRGNFTFFALGRPWAKESFRSVETRYHNSILVDGLGQGYWPGPGCWLGLQDQGWALMAACDAKPAYDWQWSKEIVTEDPDRFVRFQYPRWQSYQDEAARHHREYADLKWERDDRPSVVAHFQGFEKGDPRMWDEDAWPKRVPHNPMQRAFRAIAFVRGDHPYLLVTDDIQKDSKERLYEWIMMTGLNTDIAGFTDNDIVLCDATAPRGEDGLLHPAKGDRQLLVRILDIGDPVLARSYTSRPQVRLETFDKKDTMVPEMKAGAMAGSRSWGLDRRLIVPSRSVTPNFKVLLFPFRAGDPLPVTTWNADRSVLTVAAGGQTDRVDFTHSDDGRTHLRLSRAGQPTLALT